MPDCNAKLVVAYIISCFPTISEAFIVEELLELRRQGIEPIIFSLKTPSDICPISSDIAELLSHVHYSPFLLSISLWIENIKLLAQSPSLYLEMIFNIFRQLLFQPVELIKSFSVFPKAVFFASIARSKECQHIHAHFVNVLTLAAMLISCILEKPFSCTAHGSDIYEYPPVDLIIRAKLAAPLITVSKYNQAYLKNSLGLSNDKIHVVHCGLDLMKFQYRHRELRTGATIQVLTVARLEYVKGIDTLLDACRLLENHAIDFHLDIIGDGSQRVMLEEKCAQLNLNFRVQFLGALPHGNVTEHYARADVFILPSRREGLPVSVMEALATGLPVVVSNITGISELVDQNHNGILVRPADSTAIAEALMELISNPQKYEVISKNSRRKIEAEFDIQQSVQQLIYLWRQASSCSAYIHECL